MGEITERFTIVTASRGYQPRRCTLRAARFFDWCEAT